MDVIKLVKKIYHHIRSPLEVKKRIRGAGNSINLNRCIVRKLCIDIEGDRNIILVDATAIIEGLNLWVRGDGHRLTIGPRTWIHNSKIHFEDQDCRISLGEECLLNTATLSAVETGSVIEVGARCGLSEKCDLRTSDSHSIIDVATNTRINPPGDIVIGDHVWVGKEAHVLKGVSIGADSIIGLRSIVTRDIPANSLAVGSPAKVIKSGVNWDYDKLPCKQK